MTNRATTRKPTVHRTGSAKASTDDHLDLGAAADRARKLITSVEAYVQQMESPTASAASRFLAAGKVYELDSHYVGAVAFYKRALLVDPECWEALARLAQTLVKASSPAEALQHATTLVAVNPAFRYESLTTNRPSSAMTVLGEALRASGYHKEAAEAYRQALVLEPTDTYSAMRYGGYLFAERRFQEARELLSGVPGLRFTGSVARAALKDERTLELLGAGMLASRIMEHS